MEGKGEEEGNPQARGRSRKVVGILPPPRQEGRQAGKKGILGREQGRELGRGRKARGGRWHELVGKAGMHTGRWGFKRKNCKRKGG